MTDYTYLDFSVFNDTDAPIPCTILQNKFSNALDNDVQNYKMTIARFNIDNSLLPAYVPNIRLSNPIPPSGNVLNSDLTCDSTDLMVMVETENLTTSTIIYSGISYVNWVAIDPNVPIPTQLSQYNTEQAVIQNPYYHSFNSLHICKLIAKAITDAYSISSGLPPGVEFHIAKQSETYSLLYPVVLLNNITNFPIVSISRSVAKLLPFHTYPHPTIKGFFTIPLDMGLCSLTSVGLPAKDYAVTNTLYKSALFSPFQKILLKTRSIPIVPEMLSDTNNVTSSKTHTIVTDFLLDVDDVDTQYNLIVYNPSSYVRWINFLSSTPLTTFDITVSLITARGSELTLMLDTGASFGIKMLLTDSE